MKLKKNNNLSKVRNRKKCPVCLNKKINFLFKFIDTPFEDDFVTEKDKRILQKTYPLVLAQCKNCSHVFLKYVVDQSINYKFNFSYKTAVTKGLIRHYDDFFKKLILKYNIKKKSLCVDIGSNDGSILNLLKKKKMNPVGVEPSISLSNVANKKGFKTLNSFFTENTVKKIKKRYGKAKLIVTNYTFANIENILKFTKNIKNLLDKDGIVVLETGYHPKQMKNNMFDYIYHEHYSYFSLENLNYLFSKCGMRIVSAEITKPKGGSVRVIASLFNNEHKVSSSIEKIIKNENKAGINKVKFYKKFYEKNIRNKINLRKKLWKIKQKGKTIVGFGASHSTTRLIYEYELKNFLSYIVDDNKNKQNLYSPGYHLPVYPVNKIYKDKIDVVLILAWQHKKSIISKHKKFIKTKGRFLLPF